MLEKIESRDTHPSILDINVIDMFCFCLLLIGQYNFREENTLTEVV